MIKNAIKAVTLYTMTGLTIRRPTISKNRHLLVFFNYTPIFSFQRQTDADVRPLPHDHRCHDANAPLTHKIPVLRPANRLPYSADHLYDAGGYLGNTGGYLHAAADHLWRHASNETEARIGRKRAPFEAEARNGRHAPANAVYKSISWTANRIKIIIKRIKRLYKKGIADTGRHQ